MAQRLRTARDQSSHIQWFPAAAVTSGRNAAAINPINLLLLSVRQDAAGYPSSFRAVSSEAVRGFRPSSTSGGCSDRGRGAGGGGKPESQRQVLQIPEGPVTRESGRKTRQIKLRPRGKRRVICREPRRFRASSGFCLTHIHSEGEFISKKMLRRAPRVGVAADTSTMSPLISYKKRGLSPLRGRGSYRAPELAEQKRNWKMN